MHRNSVGAGTVGAHGSSARVELPQSPPCARIVVHMACERHGDGVSSIRTSAEIEDTACDRGGSVKFDLNLELAPKVAYAG